MGRGEVVFEGELIQRRELDDKRLGQNKVLCSSFRNWIANGQLLCRLPNAPCARETYLWLPVGFWLLELYWLGFLLVLSSLSSCLARLLARLGALLSASCQLSLFPLDGELDCWLSHRRSKDRGCWCCCRLFWIVFVESADHLPEMHDCQRRFPGIFFFQVAFPCNQIV